MAKQIKSLVTDPPTINLTDKPVSILVDPDNGNILLTEGGGDDRMNSAVLYARKSPRFSVTPVAGGYQIAVHCRDFHWPVGTTTDESAATRWAIAANGILAAFDAPATPDTPTQHEAGGHAPAATDSTAHA
jgi:hypothetical protein